MITHAMNLRVDEQVETVQAAIVHDLGKLTVPKNIMGKDTLSAEEQELVRSAEVQGYDLIDIVFSSSPNIKRICAQAQRTLASLDTQQDLTTMKRVNGARVLAVAETYDTMTAMQVEKDPESEVGALKHLLAHPEVYDSRVVNGLIKSINILAPGTSVELNTGDKALVLAANEQNILEPMILMFGDNSIVDLSDREMFDDLEIKDIMKTMDNRHVMDINLLKQQGIQVEEPEYVPVK